MKTPSRLALALVAALAAAGCAREIGGASVDSSQIGAAVPTERGIVESARFVRVQEGDRAQDNLLGAAVGGVAGGVAGSTVGAGSGRTLATLGGALAGAAVGSAIQQQTSRQTAVEYIVRLSGGRSVAIVQADATPIPVGSAVFVQMGGGGQRARISPVQ